TGIAPGVKNTVIVPFLVGEATIASGGLGTASGTPNTFVTYNATTGLRPLNPTDEFTLNTFTAGNNIRINSNSTATSTLSVNCLSIAGNDLSINNTITVTDTSGAVLFSSSLAAINPGTAGTNTLAFGAAEGVVSVNSGLTGTIADVITGSA